MSEQQWSNELAGMDAGTGEHLTLDLLKMYVNHTLSAVDRATAEQHIGACDGCLQLFMTAVETAEMEAGSDDQAFASEHQMEQLEQRVISQLLDETVHEQRRTSVQERPYRRSSWLQHPVTHYTVAASITLLLLGSGTFTSITHRLAELDVNVNKQIQVQEPLIVPNDYEAESWSHKLVDQTGSWLDGLRATRFK